MEPSRKKMRMTLRSDSKKSAVQPLLKLPKLPLLAQIKVIKMMTTREQYLLSKCSKRTCHMVKTSMPKINKHEIWVKFGRDPDFRIRVIVQFYLKVAKTMVLIHTDKGEFSPEKHKYFCDLFKAPTEVYAIWPKFDPECDEFPRNCAIRRTNLLEYRWCYSALKEFSKLHPSQDLVLLHGTYAPKLTGEHLLMEDVLISKFFIEVFVDRWMRTSNDRLKSVILKLNREAVIGNLKYEKFCGSDRQYHYDSPIKDYHKFPNGLFDCSEGYEIRRETDGKVAIIKITKHYFLFLVW
ncbi:unnamed protein product [Caenorhabditis brenneri]